MAVCGISCSLLIKRVSAPGAVPSSIRKHRWTVALPNRVCRTAGPHPQAVRHTLTSGVTGMSQRTRVAVADALTTLFPDAFTGEQPGNPDDGPPPRTTGRRPLTDPVAAQVGELVGSGDFDAWSAALARVGNCARPIRLHGRTQAVDLTTGEILSSYSSSQEPLGITYVRCGNRRETVCPSCSRLYAADTFQLIRAGVVGGKTVPETVAENPLVFVTLTAPSFGHVHGCRDQGTCRPATRGPSRCRHNRPTTCAIRHGGSDPSLGQPLCPNCYDYASHVVWQWWAPDLWRRFTIGLRRAVAKDIGVPASGLDEHATVQYAKVAEFQLRGAVHFHALVRLDGPKTPGGFAPAPSGIDGDALRRFVVQTARSVCLKVPGVDGNDPDRVLAFGRQLDVRPVRSRRRNDDPERALTPEQVAGYLAKYATKAAADSDRRADDDHHHQRIRATARRLAVRAGAVDSSEETPGPYELLGKWVHMLGFRGHFATKSRRYSVTLGALRRARRRAQALIAEHRATGRHLDLAALEADLLADDREETTLVISHWTYAGTGWATEGQTALAIASATRARERVQEQSRHRRKTQVHQPDDEE